MSHLVVQSIECGFYTCRWQYIGGQLAPFGYAYLLDTIKWDFFVSFNCIERVNALWLPDIASLKQGPLALLAVVCQRVAESFTHPGSSLVWGFGAVFCKKLLGSIVNSAVSKGSVQNMLAPIERQRSGQVDDDSDASQSGKARIDFIEGTETGMPMNYANIVASRIPKSHRSIMAH
ncbi:uncharacterized protein ATNIH1004_010397 [Aspergillus tanneri]|uniref:Uncharacterized protein n=1 Tax=Aspergillus tanneri TaxID=1220188 RepID=A0A5M9M9Q6_9EURO|nr:uncharacterized protein ATNIH1004_010397 [Aspergillus tanneri]KAA8643628.1 hypothetical protein ATNIH1004_010397 [Aspergillus tanneri]